MAYHMCKVLDTTPFYHGFWADNRKELLAQIKRSNLELVKSTPVELPMEFKTVDEAQKFVKKFNLGISGSVDFFEIRFMSLSLAFYQYVGNDKSTTVKRAGYYKCTSNAITGYKIQPKEMKKLK